MNSISRALPRRPSTASRRTRFQAGRSGGPTRYTPVVATCGRCGADNAPEARFCSRCGTALLPEPAAIKQTRRLVTAVFIDIVGSTALGERLDPERWRAVQGHYFTVVRQAVERHGGIVEKYIGDAVLAIFGAPIAHEDDALRAVRAASEAQQTLAQPDEQADLAPGSRLVVRVGIDTGEVVASEAETGEALASGETLATAARLEQAAQPGEILLGSATHALVRDAVAVEAIEPLTLRGKVEPTAAYRLLRLVGDEAHVRHLEVPLIGRRAELASLEHALDETLSGPSVQLVTVVGPAGAGKSRLIQAFLERAEGRAALARGRCLPYGDGITYWPITEILRDLAGLDATATKDAVAVRLGGLLPERVPARDRVAGILATLLGMSTAPTSADDVAWAVRRTLGALAADAPLVMVVEDIHWADPVLLDLGEAIVDWISGAAILLVCVTRPELYDRRPSWGADRANAHRIDLAPLDDADADAMLAALPGGEAVPAALRERILEVADGNPLFVEEMVSKLVDDRVLQARQDGWAWVGPTGSVQVPLSITSLIGARLDGLERHERATAERASVVGRVFERGAVAELSPLDERGAVGGRLLILSRKQVIALDGIGLDGDDAFRFRHILIRDAAYQRLTKAERADLHERFAAWLERVSGDRAPEYVEILAHHLASAVEYRLELGAVGGVEGTALARAAVTALVAAAEHATRVFAHGEASRLYERALTILRRVPEAAGPGEPTFPDLEARRAEALHLAGDHWAAADALRDAINTAAEHGSPTRAAALSERLATYLWDAGDEAGALTAAAAAVDLMPARPASRERAALLASHARLLMLANRDVEALDVCRSALEVARATEALHELAGALITEATLIGRSDPRRGIEMLEAARRFAEGLDDVFQVLRADNNICVVLHDLREFDRATEVTARAISVASKAGLERTQGLTLYVNSASFALWSSRPTQAIALAERAIAIGSAGDHLVAARAAQGLALNMMGEPSKALDAIAAARQAASRGTTPDTMADLITDEAMALWWLGRPEQALARLDEAPGGNGVSLLGRVIGQVYRAMIEASLMQAARLSDDREGMARHEPGLVAAAERARSIAREAALTDGSTPWQMRIHTALLPGETARGLGIGEVAAWSTVAAEEAEVGDAYYEAYARWRHAEALAAHGAKPDAVKAAIRHARVVAERAEAGGILRDLDALAGGAGLSAG